MPTLYRIVLKTNALPWLDEFHQPTSWTLLSSHSCYRGQRRVLTPILWCGFAAAPWLKIQCWLCSQCTSKKFQNAGLSALLALKNVLTWQINLFICLFRVSIRLGVRLSKNKLPVDLTSFRLLHAPACEDWIKRLLSPCSVLYPSGNGAAVFLAGRSSAKCPGHSEKAPSGGSNEMRNFIRLCL